VVGSSGLATVAVASHPGEGPTAAAPAVVSPSATTHGDLVVGNGQTFTIQPTLGGRTYFQGGNITVQKGGTLYIENVTLSFVQFVSNTGTAQSRLSHVVHFLDAGTVDVYNSTITTDVNILNAYPKLNVTVTGTFTAWASDLAFPGWVTASGANAVFTANGTIVQGNPAIPALAEPSTILGDSEYAPSLSALNGATINLFHSTLNNTYANNVGVNGLATIAPLFQDNVSGATNVTNLVTSTTSANLTEDWLNPETAPAGNVSVWYNTSVSGSIHVPVSVWYEGTNYPLPDVTMLGNTADGFASTPFSAGLLAAINAGGLLTYLNNTGAFGGSDQIAVAFGTGAAFSTVRVAILPNLQYNVLASGAGSTINAVDSVLNLTWNPTPASPWSLSTPVPWESNKLVLTSGAAAYLANVSVPSVIPGVFSTSAVLPDATSTAFFYRWADVNLTGRGGIVPIYGATEHAFYAYGTTQANNATANSLNDLATTSPALWGYVQYRDHQLGYPAYGMSGRSGVASLLLASSVLTASDLPDGNFVGSYHVGLLLPIVGNSSRWFNWSVSPYPSGVALDSPGYAGPDFGPNQHFPAYFAGAAFQGAPVVMANGTAAPAAGVRIGQEIGFESTLVSTGPAPITELSAALWWGNATSTKELDTFATPLNVATVGGTYSFALSWVVNDTVTGLNGTENHAFTVAFTWNPGNVSGLAGTATLTENVTILPSQIAFTSFSTPPTSLDVSQLYSSSGVLQYNGTRDATIELFATPTKGGAQILIAAGTTLPGSFTIDWYPLNQGGASQLSPGTSYYLQAVAVYNHATASISLPGVYTVPGAASPTSFLTQSVLGLPLWIWLAIAAGVAIGIVGALVVLRRQAAGKLVECGECGNLIPEEATVCPKCGAEFESDLVRCSRCASTIPANSAVCPECAAQLLGVPGAAPEEAERQGYQDFTEKYRAEAKKELGENYNEGSFWDWWKRQPSYVSYSQWKLQQGQGSPRMGMSQPPATGTSPTPVAAPPAPTAAPVAPVAPPRAAPTTPPMPPAPRAAPPPPAASGTTPAPAPPSAPSGLKTCPTCSKEIPADYLVCPFCGSVTQ
jgi:RNA polymerase subunit RPABC4/transcription elongation factor Spt4